MAHAVPFIHPKGGEEDGFVVNPEAIDVLARIKTPLAPVAVVGKYRTGKSFLLNKLISSQEARGGAQQARARRLRLGVCGCVLRLPPA